MAFSQCSYCNRLFNSIGDKKVCPVCRTMLDEAFIKIRNYLYKNPETTNMVTVSEDLEIPEKIISFLIDEGRLEFAGMGGKNRCRVCGAPCDGALCSKCKGAFVSETKGLSSDLEKAKKEEVRDPKRNGITFHYKRNK